MNMTLHKSLRACMNPAVLAALLILFINDHFLRIMAPSWWTGKISDFAWLFVVPFPLAVLISWLPSIGNKKQPVILSAISIPALIFSLAKTIPLFHHMTINFTQHLLSAPINLQRDPTDLIALPVLALSWWVWEKTPEMPFQRLSYKMLTGLIALPLAALLTIANVGAPDVGVECFQQQGNEIFASTGWQNYTSLDGGLTWQSSREVTVQCEEKTGTEFTITNPSDEKIQYRVIPDQRIELSGDGGNTWTEVYTLQAYTPAEKAYFLKNRPGNIVLKPLPLDGIIDANTGNAIFSMGQQGVLVRTQGGEWQWAAVGDYQKANLRNLKFTWTLLLGEIILALITGCLIFATSGLRLHGKLVRWNLARFCILVLGWVTWLATILILPPAITYGYAAFIPNVLLITLAILSIPTAIEALIQYLRKSPLHLLAAFPFSIAGGALFLLPYFLWSRNVIASYYLAAGFAIILTILVCIPVGLIKPVKKN